MGISVCQPPDAYFVIECMKDAQDCAEDEMASSLEVHYEVVVYLTVAIASAFFNTIAYAALGVTKLLTALPLAGRRIEGIYEGQRQFNHAYLSIKLALFGPCIVFFAALAPRSVVSLLHYSPGVRERKVFPDLQRNLTLQRKKYHQLVKKYNQLVDNQTRLITRYRHLERKNLHLRNKADDLLFELAERKEELQEKKTPQKDTVDHEQEMNALFQHVGGLERKNFLLAQQIEVLTQQVEDLQRSKEPDAPPQNSPPHMNAFHAIET